MGDVIRVPIGELDAAGSQFNGRRGDMESIISQVNNLMSELQGSYLGNRATATFQEWASMQPNLASAVKTLELTSNFLRQAVVDFTDIDNRRIS